MGSTTLRKLAAQCLRLAGLAKDDSEALRMRLAAADFQEMADRGAAPAAQQQQQIQPKKEPEE